MKTNNFQTIENLKSILVKEPMLINLNSKDKDIVIVGDLHSDINTLKKILKKYRGNDNILVFLGDYIDRPKNPGDSIKLINLITNIKLKNPENVVLLRGNHEFERINIKYGFYSDCLKFYGNSKLWYNWNEVFAEMPLAVLINNNILVLHGSIPNIKNLNEINNIPKGLQLEQNPLLDQIMWGDYFSNIKGIKESDRGVKEVFVSGEQEFNNLIKKLNIKLLIRGHQPEVKGTMFGNKCITLITCEKYANFPKEYSSSFNPLKGILIAKIKKGANEIKIIKV